MNQTSSQFLFDYPYYIIYLWAVTVLMYGNTYGISFEHHFALGKETILWNLYTARRIFLGNWLFFCDSFLTC